MCWRHPLLLAAHLLDLCLPACLPVCLQNPQDKSVPKLLHTEELAQQSQGRYALATIYSKPAASQDLLADWVGPLEVFASPIAGVHLSTACGLVSAWC